LKAVRNQTKPDIDHFELTFESFPKP